jgi:hypothetical protein
VRKEELVRVGVEEGSQELFGRWNVDLSIFNAKMVAVNGKSGAG